MKDFIKIQNVRLRKSSIKKYAPLQDTKVNIYFSVSRYKTDLETFTFESQSDRNNFIEELDNIFVS